MLIDKYMPAYQFHEVHTITVKATPDRVFEALQKLTAKEIALFGTLIGLRQLPARLTGRGKPRPKNGRPLLEQVLRGGFILLEEATSQEIVLGTIGQFWKPRVPTAPRISQAQEFVDFAQPGYAKSTINFQLEPTADGTATKIRTETRIYAPDAPTRQKFAAYWRLIYPGSALIRVMWLRAVKRRAEQSVETVPVPDSTLLNNAFSQIDYGDAYRVRLAGSADTSLDDVLKIFSTAAPGWVGRLMGLRNQLVKLIGLEAKPISSRDRPIMTGQPGTKIGFFKVFQRSSNEIVMGEDDLHLNYRVSILLQPDLEQDFCWATISTIVHYNNWRGKLYFLPVRPFHRLIVPAMLKNMANKA